MRNALLLRVQSMNFAKKADTKIKKDDKKEKEKEEVH